MEEGGGRQHDQKKEEAEQLHPNGKRRDHPFNCNEPNFGEPNWTEL